MLKEKFISCMSEEELVSSEKVCIGEILLGYGKRNVHISNMNCNDSFCVWTKKIVEDYVAKMLTQQGSEGTTLSMRTTTEKSSSCRGFLKEQHSIDSREESN